MLVGVAPTILRPSLAAAVATTWSATDKTANMILSEGNLYAVKTTGSAFEAVRSSTTKTAGPVYAEFVVTAPDVEMGLQTLTSALGDLYNDPYSAWCYSSSQLYFFRGGTQLAVLASISTGSVVQMWWDSAAGSVKFAVNNSVIYEITGYAPGGRPLALACCGFSAGGGARLRTRTSQFLGAPPPGFQPWDAS